MNHSFLRRLSIGTISMLFSFSIFAEQQTEHQQREKQDFTTICTDSWMKNADNAKDKVDFKNFGEKYCGCAAKQPLENEAAIDKAVRLCISRTLLHDTMDSLDDEVGLSKAKDTDITDYCFDRWSLVQPKQSDDDKKIINAYCGCAKPKLMDLIKQSDNMTDKHYEEHIDKIADECSDDVIVTENHAQ